MTLEAIIFDVDGTLAETEELHRLAFNQAFVEAGLDWSWDRALYCDLLRVTGGKERVLHYWKHHLGLCRETDDIRQLVAAIHRRKTSIYAQLVANGAVDLRPGVRELIRAAHHEGIRLAIATTTSLTNVSSLLARTLGPDGAGLFELIAAGDAVPRKKPNPDIYVMVLTELRLPASSCLALEDSRNGLVAATAAGIATIVIKSIYGRDDDFADAICVVDELPELCSSRGDRVAQNSKTPLELLAAARRLHAAAAGTHVLPRRRHSNCATEALSPTWPGGFEPT